MTQEQDRYAFLKSAADALRRGDLGVAEREAVAEELEQLSRSDARELRSRITQIIEHLLKLLLTESVIAEHNARLWTASVARQRNEIETLLEESPSLRRHLTAELLAECYRRAASPVATEYGLQPPPECPFTWHDILPPATGKDARPEGVGPR